MEEMSEQCYWLFKVFPPTRNIMWWDVHKSENSRIIKCWRALPVCNHVVSRWLLRRSEPPYRRVRHCTWQVGSPTKRQLLQL